MSRLSDIERKVNRSLRPGRGTKIISDARGERLVFTGGLGVVGSMKIDVVTSLPQIPTKGPKIVWWLGPDKGGTGDNQLWASGPGRTRWYPLMVITDKSGVPQS